MTRGAGYAFRDILVDLGATEDKMRRYERAISDSYFQMNAKDQFESSLLLFLLFW
jgi:hypothetical protein